MAVFGSLSTVQAQLRSHPNFELSYAYLAEVLRPGSEANKRLQAIEAGTTDRVELGNGVFSLEQVYLSKLRATGNWESHTAYIDIQVIVSGEEVIEVADVSRFTLAQDFRPEKDLLFYKPFDGGSVLRMEAGSVAVFFPVDCHLSSIALAAPSLVRKVVVKVPVI